VSGPTSFVVGPASFDTATTARQQPFCLGQNPSTRRCAAGHARATLDAGALWSARRLEPPPLPGAAAPLLTAPYWPHRAQANRRSVTVRDESVKTQLTRIERKTGHKATAGQGLMVLARPVLGEDALIHPWLDLLAAAGVCSDVGDVVSFVAIVLAADGGGSRGCDGYLNLARCIMAPLKRASPARAAVARRSPADAPGASRHRAEARGVRAGCRRYPATASDAAPPPPLHSRASARLSPGRDASRE
jgi:hypothetical protein